MQFTIEPLNKLKFKVKAPFGTFTFSMSREDSRYRSYDNENNATEVCEDKFYIYLEDIDVTINNKDYVIEYKRLKYYVTTNLISGHLECDYFTSKATDYLNTFFETSVLPWLTENDVFNKYKLAEKVSDWESLNSKIKAVELQLARLQKESKETQPTGLEMTQNIAYMTGTWTPKDFLLDYVPTFDREM